MRHAELYLLLSDGCVFEVNTGVQALNGNAIKYYISSTIKCIGEIDTFLDLSKFLMCSLELMETISDTIHIKMMFSFSPAIGKHFIGNALCSSDGSVMH
jgi:hypothetical protein